MQKVVTVYENLGTSCQKPNFKSHDELNKLLEEGYVVIDKIIVQNGGDSAITFILEKPKQIG